MFIYEQKNNSHILFSKFNIYTLSFFEGKCYVSTDIDMCELYYLDSIAHENDKIIIYK